LAGKKNKAAAQAYVRPGAAKEHTDALALSFARLVAKKSPLERMGLASGRPKDCDPYA
jgi:hypothetical protein